MNITMIGNDCAKITLSADECRELDISYESFSPDDLTARLFLASVIARLETLGAKIGSTEKLTAEVFEDESGGLVMYLSGRGMKVPVQQEKLTPVICKTDKDVIQAARKLRDGWQLYRLNDCFAFVSKTDTSITGAKIKEHGRLISDAPFKKLNSLF